MENKCCERHQFSINDSDCLDRTLFDDCDEIGDNGLCRKCSDGKVLLDEGHFNFCCDPGQNVVADECADIAVTITDCEI
ncbi:MAG: hypothetical protein DHS20C13_28630 [Thermodesulfobacteriota bacterium]|nr:MAG: hypothetical protein DHS20C13_28630 [Thermodesulfobacteriota bacterium]